MENKGLTLSIIFEAESANYGEGGSNYSALKKLSRGDGATYSYISRQAMRYSIIKQLGWDTPVEATGSGDKKVVQFKPDTTISDYPEIDLFGYMKTVPKLGAIIRNAVVRLSNAVSLESYNADTDFLNNMGLAKRANVNNNLAQIEIHKSYYAYTVTIDLDRIGIGDKEVKENTLVGYIGSIFANSKEIEEKLKTKSIGEVFDLLNKEVQKYYA